MLSVDQVDAASANEMPRSVKLSICIATYNRGAFIGETLDSILSQMQPGVELIVVDGASSDNTPAIMERFLAQSSGIGYYRENENSGVDRDYDKAVGYAAGEYCWLMTDDDLLQPGSLKQVLAALQNEPDLVIVNSEARSANFSTLLKPRVLEIEKDLSFLPSEWELFFKQCANYMSFIGCVVIRRSIWIERKRQPYFGTLFIHVGVIFQERLTGMVYVIANPLISIRYGNANWTSRAFEIWMFKWPQLLWSFGGISVNAKRAVCALDLIESPKVLFYQRAVGGYNWQTFKKHILGRRIDKILTPLMIIAIPARLANFAMLAYFFVFKPFELMKVNDLLWCRVSTKLGRKVIEKLFMVRDSVYFTRLPHGKRN